MIAASRSRVRSKSRVSALKCGVLPSTSAMPLRASARISPLLDTFCRPKKGFGIPIAEWLKGRLNPLMHELLAPARIKEQGLFNSEFVRKLIQEHETGAASHHKQLWTLLVFQLWADNFPNKNLYGTDIREK